MFTVPSRAVAATAVIQVMLGIVVMQPVKYNPAAVDADLGVAYAGDKASWNFRIDITQVRGGLVRLRMARNRCATE